MEMESRYMYPLFKMILGVICLILSIEYAYAFCIYQAASFGIMYIGDVLTWFFSGGILFTEGLHSYIQLIREEHREKTPLRASHRA